MPFATITTNVDLDPAQRETLLVRISSRVAELLNKPAHYVMVAYSYNANMLFSGTGQPLAYVELKSIALPSDKTTILSQALCEAITDITAITGDRIYIEFTDAARHMWGWDQRTFAD